MSHAALDAGRPERARRQGGDVYRSEGTNVEGKTVCLVSCQRSPEPVYLKWQGIEKSNSGDFFVRSGRGTVRLEPNSASEYVRPRFDVQKPG